MAHESFEDSATAALMNKYFINIKVDREERPDVDQIYMDAVQKMGLNGGWPLNVFLTPDQKPFYGGTYFPKEGWQKLLQSVADAFEKNRDEIEKSADQFAQAISQSELAQFTLDSTATLMTEADRQALFEKVQSRFDTTYGVIRKAPKFPMPTTWQMLATYHHLTDDSLARKHLLFTLEKIANGGIYDHVGGGFARYSVDGEWHVPHFEKMLYDNGQLLSLYAHAYQMDPRPQFKSVMLETMEWLEREMLHESGGFYAALDADSEGEEGKFYVWSEEDFLALAGKDARWLSAYYDVQPQGNWEEGKNVLRVVMDEQRLLEPFDMDEDDFRKKLTSFKRKALAEREKRVRPGLDNKRIAGWNGWALKGLCDAYQATGEQVFLDLAEKNATFLMGLVQNGQLMRFPDQDMEGFLEDYAAVIQAFISYYQTRFEPRYLQTARVLTDRVEEAFLDEKEGYYFFTSDASENLIARKKEIFDNVIPSSNAIMARNLFYLGTLLYHDPYLERAREMVSPLSNLMAQEPEYLSQWSSLAMEMTAQFSEVVIIGPEYEDFSAAFHRMYWPNLVISAAKDYFLS
jgi:hypothetical protein